MNGTNSSAKLYDMVVIGAGAAGHHGANQAAKLGKKITVVKRSIALERPASTPVRFRARHFGRLSCVLPDQGPRECMGIRASHFGAILRSESNRNPETNASRNCS
jgi:hypothetical protein